jgi:hypothetical protein
MAGAVFVLSNFILFEVEISDGVMVKVAILPGWTTCDIALDLAGPLDDGLECVLAEERLRGA